MMFGGIHLLIPYNAIWITDIYILCKVCNGNHAAIDETTFIKVKDLNIKSMSHEYLVILKKVAITLDII